MEVDWFGLALKVFVIGSMVLMFTPVVLRIIGINLIPEEPLFRAAKRQPQEEQR